LEKGIEKVLIKKYKSQILDLEVKVAKLKVELKFYKNELKLCKEG